MAGTKRKRHTGCSTRASIQGREDFCIRGAMFRAISLKRKRRIALYYTLVESRCLAGAPKRCSMDDAIQQWSPVPIFDPLNGPRHRDELAFEPIGRYSYY
jgi:hypothetical protein